MLAAVTDQLDAGRNVEIREVDEPEVGPGESLVAIEAAAVAHFDLTILSGEFFAPPPLPFIAGAEAGGRVLASETLEVGTRVRVGGAGVGVVRAGTWAERVAAPDAALEALAPEVDAGIAATCFYAATTAEAALHTIGQLQPGQRVAVTGATGSVSDLTIQLALRAGASKVVGFHRSAAQADLIPAGAESVVWEGAATADRFRGDDAFDLVVDVVGGEALSLLATRSIKPGGAVAMVGYAASDDLSVSITDLIVNDVRLLPVNTIRLEDEVRGAAQAMLSEVGSELQLRTTRLPLGEIDAALDLLRGGTAGARILVEP
ncbi:MAG: zinc-binding alcohol dehydrogenase family protein [Actinobacteria bacterium]|nr:zinc-binding alcohol dehydrogenase family protein [Actinomycetota bacterium]